MCTEPVLKNLNLLFIDDNRRISAEMYTLFSGIFQNTTLANDVPSARKILAAQTIDIIISDINMPGENGLDFIEAIRESGMDTPVIIISAHTDKDYLLRAANLQIDGYITKPLSLKKLFAALSLTARKLEHRVSSIRITGRVNYHPLTKTLKVGRNEISLGNKEYRLLELLLHNSHRVVSKDEIRESVWPDDIMTESALKNLLGELRKKLKYTTIQNKPARGWMLIIETDD